MDDRRGEGEVSVSGRRQVDNKRGEVEVSEWQTAAGQQERSGEVTIPFMQWPSQYGRFLSL